MLNASRRRMGRTDDSRWLDLFLSRAVFFATQVGNLEALEGIKGLVASLATTDASPVASDLSANYFALSGARTMPRASPRSPRTDSNTNRPHPSINGSHQSSLQHAPTGGEAGTDPLPINEDKSGSRSRRQPQSANDENRRSCRRLRADDIHASIGENAGRHGGFASMARAGRGSGTLADVEVDDVRSRLDLYPRSTFPRCRFALLPPKRLFPDRPSICIISTATLSCYSQFCSLCRADRDLQEINLGRRNRDNDPESARDNATQRLCPSASNCYNCASQKQKTVLLRQQRR